MSLEGDKNDQQRFTHFAGHPVDTQCDAFYYQAENFDFTA